MITYRDLSKRIKTGDLLCFQSTTWVSYLTRAMTNSPYTHVAMAVVMNSKQVRRHHIKEHFSSKLRKAAEKMVGDEKKDGKEAVEQHGEVAQDAADVGGARLAFLQHGSGSRMHNLLDLAEEEDEDDDDDGSPPGGAGDEGDAASGTEERQILFYESTKNGDRTPDVTSGYNNFTGVHCFEARQRVSSYSGKVYHIPLKAELPKKGERVMRRWIMEQHRKKTPFDYFQMFGAGVLKNFNLHNEHDLAELFCSEFVTACLQLATVVPSDTINASEQTPADVAKFDCYDPSKLVEIKKFSEKRGLPVQSSITPAKQA